jgi:hypothetical protein
MVLQAGLPDGLFYYQKSQFGYILEGLGMENVGIFYDHLEYIMAFWYNLWRFGAVSSHLVFFAVFGMFRTKKSGSSGFKSFFFKIRLVL